MAPALFVVLWSTGFIGAKLGLPYAEPLTFLLLRFAIVIVLLVAVALALRRPWPADVRQLWHIGLAGVLLHGGYLSGVFCAIRFGMAAGTVALIVGLQPLLTVVAGSLVLGERISARQGLGFALGLAGVALVVWNRVSGAGMGPAALGLSIMALVSITVGTVYQKRFCPSFDLWTGSVVQFVAAGAVLLPFALAFETMTIQWSGPFLFALGWLVVVLSVGAISLLHLLIRRGAATRVSALFYLVPATTALFAWLLFDERLGPPALAGMGLSAFAVWLVLRK